MAAPNMYVSLINLGMKTAVIIEETRKIGSYKNVKEYKCHILLYYPKPVFSTIRYKYIPISFKKRITMKLVREYFLDDRGGEIIGLFLRLEDYILVHPEKKVLYWI